MTTYNLPVLPQYLFDKIIPQSYHAAPENFPLVKVLENTPPTCRPLEYLPTLKYRIFKDSNQKDKDLCDFLSDQTDVQKSQLQLLLAQLEARHGISYKIRSNLEKREIEVRSELTQKDWSGTGQYYNPKECSQIQKRLDDVQKEKNMEYVALWRDSQKILLDIFKHWSAHGNLKRKSEVIGSDF